MTLSRKSIAATLVATFVLAFGLVSCNGSSAVGSIMQAAGIPGEVMLVMDGPDFSSQAAHDIVDILEQPAPALPQEESSLSVTSTVAKAGFSSIARRARNIIIVEIDPTRFTECSMHVAYDEWAQGQLVVRLLSPDLDKVSAFVRDNAEGFVNVIVRHELYRFALATKDVRSQRATEYADSLFALRIDVPRDVQNHKFGSDFLWMSNAQMRQRKDLLIYTFPYTHPRDLGLDRLVEVRDSVLREHIKGEFEGTYPITFRSGLLTRQIQIPGQPTRTEVRGLWEMHGGAMMGGPFVQHAYYDKARGRVVVVEGFVYRPNEDKLTLIRTMEASLYSARPSDQKEFEPRTILSATYTRAK